MLGRGLEALIPEQEEPDEISGDLVSDTPVPATPPVNLPIADGESPAVFDSPGPETAAPLPESEGASPAMPPIEPVASPPAPAAPVAPELPIPPIPEPQRAPEPPPIMPEPAQPPPSPIVPEPPPEEVPVSIQTPDVPLNEVPPPPEMPPLAKEVTPPQATAPSAPPSPPAPQPVTPPTMGTAAATPPARSLEDHFMPRRSGESVFWIELEKVEPNPYQPRREFAPEALQDLSRSIREHGVLQPVLVSKREIETPSGLEVRYQLIAGERRWRASQLAGLTQVPAVIRRGMPDDRIKLELAIIENVQREDLNAIERAVAFKRFVDEFNLVHREIAERVGKSREYVANTLRLLVLPEEIQHSIADGSITEGHARAVLMAGEDTEKQFQVFHSVVEDRLSVREAENKARQVSGRSLVPRTKVYGSSDPQVRDWENQLQEKFGTRVQLQRRGKRGKIVMEFFSEEELKGILEKLMEQQERLSSGAPPGEQSFES